MVTFVTICYTISLTLSVTTFITGIFVGIKRLYTIKILPKALRLFMMTCCFPFFLSSSLCSTYNEISYFVFDTQTHISTDYIRLIILFSTQNIRNTFTFIMIERIVATVKLEKYIMADKISFYWKLTVFSLSTALLYVGYYYYVKNMPWMGIYSTYFAYSSHIFMLTVCGILYLLNRRMYKISAYQITLKRRYTIAQNIRCLAYLFPSILIYSTLASFGSMITIIFQALGFPSPPLSVYHIFFNTSFLLIYIRHFFIKPDKISDIKNVTAFKNPLGKDIPTNATPDQYFVDLRNQWK